MLSILKDVIYINNSCIFVEAIKQNKNKYHERINIFNSRKNRNR
jgi:hypothetical protein